ncbi:acetoacetate--CoA ligase [Roseisolibacter agri]|uniref:Acetoacetyl-CoA synthetase n=1 Tax=Roseisolibacter agri TaxID=2014610 RepID=A0AA37QF46_9BACT|nr:acetoacetate--CoA ligase [Roseisolibacter agri]GLC27711.1 acetoacetyl-CoA synthetase [Roseisolibacter agri]
MEPHSPHAAVELDDARPIWTPSAEDVARANLTAFAAAARRATGAPLPDYAALWRWSVDRPTEFWPLVWRFCDVRAERADGGDGEPWDAVLIGGDRMAPPDPQRGPRWFTGARLNFAEHLLRHAGARDAIVAWTERGPSRRLSFDALRAEVARVADGLRGAGVGVGDRVGGFLPNGPEAVIAMLATASLGAVWSSCSPDFGVQGVLDRFGQIEPVVLVCADGYEYAGKPIDTLPRVREIVAAIPSIRRTVVVAQLRDAHALAPELDTMRGAVAWEAFGNAAAPLAFTRLPFDHPLYVMYSSGTTGLPKCMVHGAGGTLLQHLKELALHTDLGPDDRIFYFTTCGWMMWNWLVSSLAVGATIVLYDGAALAPRAEILWDMAAAERVTVFGTSAKYLALVEKAGVRPAATHDLSALRAVLSTGSPLAAHSYDFVARDVKPGVRLSSISGGTDIISCFALGNPTAPVWRGELQARGLGMAVDVFDADGHPLRGAAGELVCTRPFPSMPVGFWNDPDGAKYRAAYFDVFPNVWRHGDWAELTAHDGLVIHGRSDATLNPGGVRIGTAELYRQVEQLPEIVESVAIEQTTGSGVDATSRIVLFVRLREGATLDDALAERLRRRIREHCSPHHVPRVIAAVPDIPRTISGKITELAVREVVHGRPVNNVDALANPEALAHFRAHPALQG